MSTRSLSALACAMVLAGCASTLNPAPFANEVPGADEGALVRAVGVQMVARAGTWDGMPADLAKKLTPMWVAISNHSGVPLRIRYNELMLVTPKAKAYKALPPFQIDAQVRTRSGSVDSVYPPDRFSYAPYFASYSPSATIYSGTFPNDRAYWKRYGPVLGKVSLPTPDMLRRALPEGILLPGGKVSGFVYFPGIGSDVEHVRLRADLINATSGKTLVSLAIPFIVG